MLDAGWGVAKLDQGVPLDRDERLEARLFPVAAKVPPFLRDTVKPTAETTTGLRITDTATGRRLVYVPGMKSLDAGTLAELSAADCRIVDGTFYTADELRQLRPGAPDAHAMGHLPITGPDSSLERLAGLRGRTIYTHMNNTNPILDPRSPEALHVRAAGVEVAEDGMEIEL